MKMQFRFLQSVAQTVDRSILRTMRLACAKTYCLKHLFFLSVSEHVSQRAQAALSATFGDRQSVQESGHGNGIARFGRFGCFCHFSRYGRLGRCGTEIPHGLVGRGWA